MKVQEIRALTSEEISARTDQIRRQYLEMKMQHYSQPGSVKPSDLGKSRKMIARLLTVLGEHKLKASEAKS